MTLLDTVLAMPARQAQLSDGSTVCYREASLPSGAANRPAYQPVMVLLHGIGSGSASWVRQLVAAQNKPLRVVAWDAPGYAGSSPVAAAQPQAADYAHRLGLWLDALGIGTVHLVGHSLGCIMAASWARQQPQRIRHLTLLAPAQGYGNAGAALRQQKLDDRLQALQQLGPQKMAQQRAPLLLSRHAHPDETALATHMMSQLNVAGYTQAAHLLSNAVIAQDLDELHCPITIACGDHDTITPALNCQALASSISASYISLPNAGHLCALQAATQVNQHLGLSP